MSRLPWAKFYFSDWENDPALAMCSMAAQGFWMRLLCIAHRSDEVGYITNRGRPMTTDQLAYLTRARPEDASRWLGELKSNGVLSIDRKGRIFSRRMVRDATISKINRDNGSKGGNPTLTNNRVFSKSDNPPVKAEAEAEAEKKESVGSASPPTVKEPWQSNADFRALWAATPPKMRTRSSQRKAFAAFGTVSRRCPPETLVGALQAYEAQDEDFKRTGGPGLHIWLADDRWEAWTPSTVSPMDRSDDFWRAAVKLFKAEGRWGETLGPRPGEPGCEVPPQLLLGVVA